MSIREYQFITGIETSTSPDPATPSADADIMTKGYADDTYAQFSSWGTKQTSNANIKAIGTADRYDGQIVFNTASNVFYRFDSGSSATDDGDTVLQPNTGSGRWLKISSGSGSGDTLTQQLDAYVAGITAGEAITANNAVSVQVHNGTGSDVLRVFKADADNFARNAFAGFATSTVTVTPQITTYTISAAFVTGNSIPFTINGRPYTVSYASSSDATLQSVATAMATDPDVQSASVTVQGGNQTGTDDRTITITSKGGLSLNITGTTVTGGASQPTITLSNTQTASGNGVDIRDFGPMTGFSSLTTGALYYLSSTAGSIDTLPSTVPAILVGQAMSSTVLFVNPYGMAPLFGTPGILVRAAGSSTNTYSGFSSSNNVEHFNLSSWSNGAGHSGGRGYGNTSDSAYGGYLHLVDGANSAGNTSNVHDLYNKTAWSSATAPSTAYARRNSAAFNSYLYLNCGMTTNTNNATVSAAAEKWNGTSYSSPASYSNARASRLNFVYSSNLYVVGGMNSSGSSQSDTEVRNSSDSVSTGTSAPDVGRGAGCTGSGTATSGGVFCDTNSNSRRHYSGSWSTVTGAYTQTGDGSVNACFSGQQAIISNGGYTGGNPGVGSTLNTTELYNGTAYYSGTASSLSQAFCYNAVI